MRKRTSIAAGVLMLCAAVFYTACAPGEKDVKASYDRLVLSYEKALTVSPEDRDLRLRYARVCYSFNDHEAVERILKGQDTVSAKVLLAKAYAHLHEYTRALELFEQCLPAELDQEGKYLYGRVLETKNLYSRAVELYGAVGGDYRDKARARLDAIQLKEEDTVPAYINDLLAESSGFLEKIRDEASVVLFVDEKEEIGEDNTSVTVLHVIEKILQERGKKIAEVEIGYDSTYERVELEFARTITGEGRIVYAGKENIRDVSKYLNFPLYSNAKAFIVSMPSVDTGAIIEYKVKITSSKLINEDDISMIYRLREASPVYKAKFALVLPKERKADCTVFHPHYAGGISLAPHQETHGRSRELSWEFKEIMPIIPEYNMPPVTEVNPAVLISTFESWDEIFRWWRDLYKDKLDVTPEMQSVLDTVTRGIDDREERAKKIYEYVATMIRYVGVEYGESGHEPHRSGEVLRNRYGDCKDQAVLLVALLKAAGFDAAPVLIPTREAYPVKKDFPSVNFNHAIAAVRLDGRCVFMDPTSETTSFEDLPSSDQGRCVLVFWDEGYQLMETPELTTSEIMYEMNIGIDPQEDAVITREVKSRGGYASYQRYYLKYTHPSKLRQNIEAKMLAISPFSSLISYRSENVDDFDALPVMTYEFKTEKFLNPSQNLRVIPPLDQLDISPSLIAGETREFPVDFSELYTMRAAITISLPENIRVKYLPPDTDIRTPWFDFTVQYKDHGSMLDFVQEFRVNKRFVGTDEYDAFRKKMKEMFYFLREEVILEKSE